MLADIIARKRAELSLSQEQLAGLLCVSRSAIAKWETGKGTPDVENIKALAGVFQISIDELLEADTGKNCGKPEESNSGICKVLPEERMLEAYYQKKCSVELSGWNNGFCDGYIVGEDREYLFYVIPEKKKAEIGAVRKSLLVSITEEKEQKLVDKGNWPLVNRNYFVGKNASVWLVDEKLIDFSFREKEFIDVPIVEFSAERVVIIAGKEFNTEEVAEVKLRMNWEDV